MERIPCHPIEPEVAVIERAVEVIAAGGVVALPTETFYGLAADGASRRALERVNLLKGKAHAPVLLLVADLAQLSRVASEIPPAAEDLARRFWPGPLTLVLIASRAAAGAAFATVAVRIPSHAVPRHVCSRLGRAITGPSANRHGGPPCTTAQQVIDVFGEELDLVLDAGPTPGGAPSTLLDLTGGRPRVLREGAISSRELAAWTAE